MITWPAHVGVLRLAWTNCIHSQDLIGALRWLKGYLPVDAAGYCQFCPEHNCCMGGTAIMLFMQATLWLSLPQLPDLAGAITHCPFQASPFLN